MRIIDADELLLQTGYFDDYDGFVTEYVLAEDVRKAPTIEAKPVVHGEWVKDGDFLICLNCESEINIKNSLGVENRKNYCPNCGAVMRGET